MAAVIGQPSPVAGDIKMLKYASGTIPTGTEISIAADSFTLPIISKGQRVVSILQLYRTSGSDNTSCSTGSTSADTGISGSPNRGSAVSTLYTKSDIYPSLITSGRMSWQGVSNQTNDSNFDNVAWGNLNAAHTIYFNIDRKAASTYDYVWIVYIVGNAVK